MSVLMVNESADFNMLKELLGVTDGNLASHTKALETENYIMIEKQFIGKKPSLFKSKTPNSALNLNFKYIAKITIMMYVNMLDSTAILFNVNLNLPFNLCLFI